MDKIPETPLNKNPETPLCTCGHAKEEHAPLGWCLHDNCIFSHYSTVIDTSRWFVGVVVDEDDDEDEDEDKPLDK